MTYLPTGPGFQRTVDEAITCRANAPLCGTTSGFRRFRIPSVDIDGFPRARYRVMRFRQLYGFAGRTLFEQLCTSSVFLADSASAAECSRIHGLLGTLDGRMISGKPYFEGTRIGRHRFHYRHVSRQRGGILSLMLIGFAT